MHIYTHTRTGSAQQRQRVRGACLPVPRSGPFFRQRLFWGGLRLGHVLSRSLRAHRPHYLLQRGRVERGKNRPVLLLPLVRGLLAHFLAVRERVTKDECYNTEECDDGL